MKHLYSLLLITLFVTSKSQTLTQSFNEPVIGDIDRSNRLDTSAYTSGLPTQITGTNCVWDFTKFVGIFPIIIDSFLPPSAVPNYSAYPNSSFAQKRNKAYSFFKSNTNPTQTELLGVYDVSLSLTFTNSAIIASYPVSYGYSLNDTVSGFFKYVNTPGACNGNFNISVDGIGTVNLPNGISIPNVIRLKSVESLTLSTSFIPVGSFNQTIYNFYMPGKKFPIVNIGYTTYQFIASTPTITSLVYGDEDYFVLVGLPENKQVAAKPKAYPNPFQNQLFIESKLEDAEYIFYNINGQEVLRTHELIPSVLDQMQAGLYTLEIKTKSGVHRQKLIKD